MSNRIDDTIKKLASGGVFLSSGNNTMTVGWGQFGVMWGKQVFIAAIRPSRYTDGLVEESGEFTVSVPELGAFGGELAFTGTKSGRDLDKWEACGLKKVKANKVNTFVVDGCKHYFECKVLSKLSIKKEDIQEADMRWYPTGDDFHNLYISEIVDSYSK